MCKIVNSNQKLWFAGDSFLPLGYPFVLPNEYDRRGKYPETSQKTPPYNSTLVDRGFRSLRAMDVRFMVSEEFLPFCKELAPWTKELFSQDQYTAAGLRRYVNGTNEELSNQIVVEAKDYIAV